jgi:hypothetical protein
MSFLGRLLDACGFDVSKPFNFEPKALHGKRCRVKVKHEMRNGNERAVVNYFLRYDKAIEQIPDHGPVVSKRVSNMKTDAGDEAEICDDAGNYAKASSRREGKSDIPF